MDNFELERMWIELFEARFMARLPYKKHQHQTLQASISESEIANNY